MADEIRRAHDQWRAADYTSAPLGLLGPYEEYCVAEAESIGVANEMILPVMLSTVSAVVGAYVEVEGHPRWREPANLWFAVAAGPGERKSPAFEAITRPLYGVQASWMDRVRPQIREARVRQQIAKKKAETAESTAGKSLEVSDDGSLSDADQLAIRLRQEADEIVVPPDPVLVVDDTTPEKLVMVMGDQHGSVANISDEGGNFFASPARYPGKGGGSENLDAILKSWSGSPIRVDRVSRDSVTIARPILTVCLALQPDLLRQVARSGTALGRGLLARFLFSFPRSLAGSRPLEPEPCPDSLTEGWASLIEDLAEEVWAIRSSDSPAPVVLRLSSEARRVYNDFYSGWEDSQADEELRVLLNGWSAKFHGQILRHAGTGHCLRHGTLHGEIDGETMQTAVELAPFLVDQAFRAQDLIGPFDRKVSCADRVVKWAKGLNEPEFSSREVQRRFSWDAEEANDVIDSMLESGRLEKLAKRGSKQTFRLVED